MKLSLSGKYFVLFVLTVVLNFFYSCVEREKLIRNQALWSSMDPMTIPYAVRLNQFNKGNLIFNSSFETGKYLLEKGEDNLSFVKGWSRVGENVEWVDLNKDQYHEDEVTDGSHAIRIHRDEAAETEETGEGIMSDFIRVIPGNYDFTFDVRLENIKPYKSRLGTKLFDAVNIRILFYDKNKIEIDGNQFYPYFGSQLDNSFKGYPFSNFWFIEEFGYGNVNGRTYNYPFSEGDIPDNAHFVRIFFGLKGTGTMWIDRADYRFSRWNFTTLERTRPLFDSSFSKVDLLLPTPKSAISRDVITYFEPDKQAAKSPLIVIPQGPSRMTLQAANLLKSKIEQTGDNYFNVPILQNVPQKLDNYSIVFNIGRTSLFNRSSGKMNGKLPENKPQSYLLDVIEETIPVVFMIGNDQLGEYYAVTTALQLFDPEKFQYHGATVADYPDFLGRSYLLNSWQDDQEMEDDVSNLNWMSLLKFNKVYIGYGQTRGRKEWYNPDKLYVYGVNRIGEACRQNGAIDLAIMINPYYHFDYEMHTDSIPENLRYAWTHSDPNSLGKLKSAFKRGLDAGAKTIMLMADDFIPHGNGSSKLYTLYTDEDINVFGNLQNAHAYTINSIHKWLSANYTDIRFEFCPPWYLNEFLNRSMGRAEHYFTDLIPKIPQEISIIWTGPTVRSLSYDLIDFERYTQLIGRKPMIWDNTLYARALTSAYGGYPAMYPGKVRMCNLFEPYDVKVPENFYSYVDGPHMYINGAASTEFYKIKYSTVADFEWNNSSYQPDMSLWKTLLSLFGHEQAIQLLEFNDAYFALTDICMKLEEGNISNRLFKQGNIFSEDLHILFSSLSGTLKNNQKLVEEISIKKEEVIQRYTDLERLNMTFFHRDSARNQ